MRLHHGKTAHNITLNTEHVGYRFQDVDGDERLINYPAPRLQQRRVTYLWGLSTRFGFIGVMRLSKPKFLD